VNETKDHYFSEDGLEIVLPQRVSYLPLPEYRPNYLARLLLVTVAMQLLLLIVLLVRL